MTPITVVSVICEHDRQVAASAIESCLNQGVDVSVLVMDARPDMGLADEVRRACSRGNVQVVPFQPDRGLAAARNEAISLSHTDFILCLDPDDMLFPGALKTMLEAADGADVVYGKMVEDREVYQPERELSEAAFRRGNPLFQSSLFSRAIWEKVGGYTESPEEPYFFEDWNFWAKIFAAGGVFKYLDIAVYVHRRAPTSRTLATESRHDIMRKSAVFGVFKRETRTLSQGDIIGALGNPRLYALVPALKPLRRPAREAHDYLTKNGLIDANGKLKGGPGCTACKGRIVLHVCRQLYKMFIGLYAMLWKDNPGALVGLSAYFNAEKVAVRDASGLVMEV